MNREEWEAAFYAYRAAQARISNAAAYLTLARWTAQVAPLNPILPAEFVAQTVQAVAASRHLSRRLAQAWFQYARALDTGFQLGDLEDGVEGDTLDNLRNNFLNRLQDAADLGGDRRIADGNQDVNRFEQALRDNDYADVNNRNRRSDRINREQVDRRIREFRDSIDSDFDLDRDEFTWRTDSSIEDLEDFLDRRLREVARRDIRERRKKWVIRDVEDGPEPTDEELAEEHRKAGQVVAGEVHEATGDAARKLHEWAFFNDSKVKAVARGTSATPCAFCAMLASRGFAYKGVQSAMTTRNSVQRERAADYTWSSGFRKVHPNCNCYPIIRWINVPGSALPALNKEFEALWKKNPTMKAFRKAIYQRNKKLIEQTNSQEE